MRKIILIIIALICVPLDHNAQNTMPSNQYNYAEFKQHVLNLNVGSSLSSFENTKERKLSSTPIIIGAVAFVGILTLNKFSQSEYMTNASYYTTCGIVIVGTTVYCSLNKEKNWKPNNKKRRR